MEQVSEDQGERQHPLRCPSGVPLQRILLPAKFKGQAPKPSFAF
jgi:hypothetical protein